MGMTSSYDEAMQEKADLYIDEFEADAEGEVVPSITALALYLGISRATAHNWGKAFPTFLDTLEKVNQVQEVKLTNGSLSNRLNSNISKLMLANHGYSDKSSVDNTSSDGSMSPRNSLDDFYAAEPKPES
jgi:hypothetical protein